MNQTEEEMIRKWLSDYDAEVNRGIVHTDSYVIKMEQYRQSLAANDA